MHNLTKGKIKNINVPCDVKVTKQSKEQHKWKKHTSIKKKLPYLFVLS